MTDAQRAHNAESALSANDSRPRTVRAVWRGLGTSALDDKGVEYDPPDGWFVDEVLPAFASNGAGVVFVLRRLP